MVGEVPGGQSHLLEEQAAIRAGRKHHLTAGIYLQQDHQAPRRNAGALKAQIRKIQHGGADEAVGRGVREPPGDQDGEPGERKGQVPDFRRAGLPEEQEPAERRHER